MIKAVAVFVGPIRMTSLPGAPASFYSGPFLVKSLRTNSRPGPTPLALGLLVLSSVSRQHRS